MATPDVESLQARLTAMEWRFRAAALAWLGSLVLMAVLWLGAQQALSQSGQTLRAGELDIVDRSGHTRIALGFSDKGNPGMWIYGENGKERAYLGLSGPTPRPQLALDDETGRNRAYLGFSSSGMPTPQLTLLDERGKYRVYVGWSTKERPIMNLTDDSGGVVWSAP